MPNSLLDKLPELPALESVESSARGLLIAGSVLLILPLIFILCGAHVCVKYWHDLGALKVTAVIAGSVMVALACWMVLRIFRADYYWKTDSDGLTAGGLIRRRHIKWTDVIRANILEDPLRGDRYHINTTYQAVVIRADKRFSNSRLLASVCQHLRRHRKVEDFKLPMDALSFYDIVPDELPQEMEWTDAKPFAWRLPLVAMFILCVASVAFFVTVDILDHCFALVVFAAMLYLPLAWGITRDYLAAADVIAINEDYIEARLPRKVVRLAWDDVTLARWIHPGTSAQRICLEIRGLQGNERMLVPFLDKNEGSKKLLLAIIRRVRVYDKHRLLVLPEALHDMCEHAQSE